MFNYTTIVDQLKTVSWSYNSYPNHVVNRISDPTCPIRATVVQSNGHAFKKVKFIFVVEILYQWPSHAVR